MTTTELARSFLDYGRYVRGWSLRTIRTYQQSLTALPATSVLDLSRAALQTLVVSLRMRGLTPGGINVRLRSINSYLSWLHAEGHVAERLRIRLLPDPLEPLTPISDEEIRRIVMLRPHGRMQVRAWTLILLLLDTGLRIDEALGLDCEHVDLHNSLVRVRGKGNRERLVPLSLECPKRMYLLLRAASSGPVFVTTSGLRLTSRNVYRDIKAVCARAGVSGTHIHPHPFRHCFAVTYIRRGGDIYKLSRLLGHASVTTTQRYLRSMGADVINEGHQRLSPLTPLNRLRAMAAMLLLTAALSAACSPITEVML